MLLIQTAGRGEFPRPAVLCIIIYLMLQRTMHW
nr:MAG TPA: hypothetical protein [Caudoviricetes sp.]